jgi:sulfur-oxidizing protein SoxB
MRNCMHKRAWTQSFPKVASWAPVAEDASGEPIWDVVVKCLRERKVIRPPQLNRPQLIGVKDNPGMA